MAKGKKTSNADRIAKMKESATERRAVFKELQKHVEGGYSLDCFAPIDEKGIYEMMESFPIEWNKAELNESIRKAKGFWEDIGKRQASGHCIGNSRSWFYNMANRYGWSERSKVEQDVKGSVTVSIVKYAE